MAEYVSTQGTGNLFGHRGMTEKEVHTSDTLISEWLIPPDEMSLNCHEVHVWRAFLHITAAHVKHLKKLPAFALRT